MSNSYDVIAFIILIITTISCTIYTLRNRKMRAETDKMYEKYTNYKKIRN